MATEDWRSPGKDHGADSLALAVNSEYIKATAVVFTRNDLSQKE